MFVSQDGYVTGSIDVSKLDEIEAKSDEAKAQLAALKAEAKAGQEQAARDAERVNETARLQHEQLHGRQGDDVARDNRDVQGKATGQPVAGEGQSQQTTEAKPGEDTAALQAEAEAAGVTVDKRWGADRLRQEIDTAKSSRKR